MEEVRGVFCFKQKTAYEMVRSLVGSEMCIRDSSVNLMVQYIRDTFGMTIEELYFLPTGE